MPYSKNSVNADRSAQPFKFNNLSPELKCYIIKLFLDNFNYFNLSKAKFNNKILPLFSISKEYTPIIIITLK